MIHCCKRGFLDYKFILWFPSSLFLCPDHGLPSVEPAGRDPSDTKGCLPCLVTCCSLVLGGRVNVGQSMCLLRNAMREDISWGRLQLLRTSYNWRVMLSSCCEIYFGYMRTGCASRICLSPILIITFSRASKAIEAKFPGSSTVMPSIFQLRFQTCSGKIYQCLSIIDCKAWILRFEVQF